MSHHTKTEKVEFLLDKLLDEQQVNEKLKQEIDLLRNRQQQQPQTARSTLHANHQHHHANNYHPVPAPTTFSVAATSLTTSPSGSPQNRRGFIGITGSKRASVVSNRSLHQQQQQQISSSSSASPLPQRKVVDSSSIPTKAFTKVPAKSNSSNVIMLPKRRPSSSSSVAIAAEATNRVKRRSASAGIPGSSNNTVFVNYDESRRTSRRYDEESEDDMAQFHQRFRNSNNSNIQNNDKIQLVSRRSSSAAIVPTRERSVSAPIQVNANKTAKTNIQRPSFSEPIASSSSPEKIIIATATTNPNLKKLQLEQKKLLDQLNEIGIAIAKEGNNNSNNKFNSNSVVAPPVIAYSMLISLRGAVTDLKHWRNANEISAEIAIASSDPSLQLKNHWPKTKDLVWEILSRWGGKKYSISSAEISDAVKSDSLVKSQNLLVGDESSRRIAFRKELLRCLRVSIFCHDQQVSRKSGKKPTLDDGAINLFLNDLVILFEAIWTCLIILDVVVVPNDSGDGDGTEFSGDESNDKVKAKFISQSLAANLSQIELHRMMEKNGRQVGENVVEEEEEEEDDENYEEETEDSQSTQQDFDEEVEEGEMDPKPSNCFFFVPLNRLVKNKNADEPSTIDLTRKSKAKEPASPKGFFSGKVYPPQQNQHQHQQNKNSTSSSTNDPKIASKPQNELQKPLLHDKEALERSCSPAKYSNDETEAHKEMGQETSSQEVGTKMEKLEKVKIVEVADTGRETRNSMSPPQTHPSSSNSPRPQNPSESLPPPPPQTNDDFSNVSATKVEQDERKEKEAIKEQPRENRTPHRVNPIVEANTGTAKKSSLRRRPMLQGDHDQHETSSDTSGSDIDDVPKRTPRYPAPYLPALTPGHRNFEQQQQNSRTSSVLLGTPVVIG